MTHPNGPSGPHQNPYGQQPQWGPGQYPQPQPPAPAPKKKGKGKWVLGILAVLVVIGIANGGSDEPEQPTTAAAPAAAEPAQAQQADIQSDSSNYGEQSGAFGQELRAGDVAVTAEKPKVLSQAYLGSQACAMVSLRNEGTSSASFSPFDWKFTTSDGVEVNANIPFNADKALNSGSLAPGGKISGQVCADSNTENVNGVVYNPGFGIMHRVSWS